MAKRLCLRINIIKQKPGRLSLIRTKPSRFDFQAYKNYLVKTILLTFVNEFDALSKIIL
jgi:hypothetical protein